MSKLESIGARNWVQARAKEVLDRSGIYRNSYFDSLMSGGMSRDDFVRSQSQFYFAVLEFARPMMGLMARLPLPHQRIGLLDNVVEEHGFFDSARFHATTFRKFLESLEGGETPGARLSPGPAVSAFNAALYGVCHAQPVETAFACLGIIELSFAKISSMIGRAVVDRGWLGSDRLVHYRLHAELDLEHAAELFEPLVALENDPTSVQAVVAGLELGAYLFDRLYRDLVPSTVASTVVAVENTN